MRPSTCDKNGASDPRRPIIIPASSLLVDAEEVALVVHDRHDCHGCRSTRRPRLLQDIPSNSGIDRSTPPFPSNCTQSPRPGTQVVDLTIDVYNVRVCQRSQQGNRSLPNLLEHRPRCGRRVRGLPRLRREQYKVCQGDNVVAVAAQPCNVPATLLGYATLREDVLPTSLSSTRGQPSPRIK